MIDPKELRIGNIVWETRMVNPFPEDLQLITVGAINGIYNTVYDNEDNIYGPEDIYPIPLTPEWLERMGFEKELQTMNLFGSYDIHFEMRKGRLYLIADSYEDEMKFVHQIQNIHYTLTGEELKIKL